MQRRSFAVPLCPEPSTLPSPQPSLSFNATGERKMERDSARAEATEGLCPPPSTRRSSSGDPFCVSQTCAKMKPHVLWGMPEDDGYTSFYKRENAFPHHNKIPYITEPVLNRYSFNTNHDSYYGDNKDPTYDLFLGHLREDGKSYIVEMPDLKNGLMMLVKYERDDLPQLPPTNNVSNETKKLKGMPYENNILDDVKNTTVSPCNVKNKKRGFSRMDESYKIYLEEHLLPSRSKISDVDGVFPGNSTHTPLKSEFKHDLVKYEKDDLPQLPLTNNVSNETKKLKGMPCENDILDDVKNTTVSPCNVKNKKRGFSRMDESYKIYLEEHLLPSKSKISDVDGVFPGNSTHTPLKSEFKHDMESPLDDYAYMKFLEKVKLENGFMVLESEPGISLKYYVDGVSANNADSIHTHEESLSMDSNKKEKKIGSTISQEERASSLFPSSFKDSSLKEENLDYVPYGFHFSTQYKNELMEALSKPYDRDEYEQLLKKATERKPMIKDKHLRARSISYETHENAPSYLDHYPDLASQIEIAGRSHRLTLLRGFFFWLQHQCHKGSFVPWNSYPTSAAPPPNVDCEIVQSLGAHLLQKSARSRETSGTV